jgi:hypothetical protein
MPLRTPLQIFSKLEFCSIFVILCYCHIWHNTSINTKFWKFCNSIMLNKCHLVCLKKLLNSQVQKYLSWKICAIQLIQFVSSECCYHSSHLRNKRFCSPRNEFDKVVVEGNSSFCIKDGRVTITNEVRWHNIVFGVVQNSFQWSFCCFLHFGLDFIICCCLA